jgi:hypothetical protein
MIADLSEETAASYMTAQAVKLRSFTLQVLCANVGPYTDYPDRCYGITMSLHTNSGTVA